jgi:serine/threonine protein phosphatase PrpC
MVFQPWVARMKHPQDECERLVRFFALLTDCVERLHAQGGIWLTFDPRHLEQTGPEQVRITNLAGTIYPPGHCPKDLQVLAQFAAPEISRGHGEDIGPRTDVFHLSLFVYYWLAGLLPHGFRGAGLEAFWYQVPKLRIFAPWVPPGISAVLAKGMAMDPALRWETPRALEAALTDAVVANRMRLDFQGQVRWDVGAETLTGRTKLALDKDNEDRILVVPFHNPERVLLAVADGITTCDVGSGALASLMAVIVLENTFSEKSTRETFPTQIIQACRTGAETLLAWAQDKGYGEQLKQGADLMGTTLTAAWLEGNRLSLANLGDSRAYLITRNEVEQLTVDGDLSSGMLAHGMPPENAHELGLMAKALRECIGGCSLDAAGEVTVLDDCCTPAITHWHLLPGDTIVLCSDGLVEEDAFLEPELLGEMVRAQIHLPAQEIAKQLCQAADQLHRLPSPEEPEGFGDNISCIVIRIEKG